MKKQVSRLVRRGAEQRQVFAAMDDAFETAAQICEDVYGNAVAALGNDEPSEVGRKLAAAIRALKSENG